MKTFFILTLLGLALAKNGTETEALYQNLMQLLDEFDAENATVKSQEETINDDEGQFEDLETFLKGLENETTTTTKTTNKQHNQVVGILKTALRTQTAEEPATKPKQGYVYVSKKFLFELKPT